MKIAAIVQARTGSTRFPNKVFASLSNKPLIWHVFNRLKSSQLINSLILATTENPNDDSLVQWANENGIFYFRGSENDVLSRYYFAAKKFNIDIIIRITADDPFKDPEIIDMIVESFINNKLNFISNNNPPTYPEGLDVEVFDIESLELAFKNSKDPYEREHVTQYFYRNPEKFKIQNFYNFENTSNLRWTIDTEVDYKMATEIYNNLFNEGNCFNYKDTIEFLKKFPEISLINIDETRSAMYNNLK
jgi:spore coat polysaccharide biosynthesis protein SpsF